MAGLLPSEVKRLKQLEEKNKRLKQLVADLSLDKKMLQTFYQKKLSACSKNKTCKGLQNKKPRENQIIPLNKNDIWSIDFVSDALFTGEKLKILTMVDASTRESPGISIRFSYKGHNVVQTLEEASMLHGLSESNSS